MNNELFFVGTGLGMESELALEIQEVSAFLLDTNSRPNAFEWKIKSIQKGGVLIECPLVFGLQLNFFLKLASRVLWQRAFFKSIHLNDFIRKINRMEILKDLGSVDLTFKVACEKSKLYHEAMLVRELEKVFPHKKNLPIQEIYIRIKNDEVTVSYNSSGEHLHKRGYRNLTPQAPLRETLAAFGLRKIFAGKTKSQIDGLTLMDPFCGSGTLLIEAAFWNHPLWLRDFSFLNWRVTPALLKSPLFKNNFKFLKAPLKTFLFGSDIDSQVLKIAEENVKKAKAENEISFKNLEFNKVEPLKTPFWVIANPPYDERLKTNIKPRDLLSRMREMKPEGFLVFGPESWENDFSKDPSFKEAFPLKNGGISIKAYLFNLITE